MKKDNAEHTPGPWTATFMPAGAGLWNTRIMGPDGEHILADTYTQFYGPGQAESEANARLIAAAPELLEALAGLLKHAPLPKGIRKDFSYTLYLEAARSAIAKAEGRNA